MAVRIDPPRRGGIVGSKSEYLIDYLSGLTRQITFELERLEKENGELRRKLEVMNTEEEG